MRCGTAERPTKNERRRRCGSALSGRDSGGAAERPNRDDAWVPADPGIFILSFERGEIRQSPKGLYRYDDNGVADVPLTVPGIAYNSEVDELCDAVMRDTPVYHDGRWGLATLEVCLAIMESRGSGGRYTSNTRSRRSTPPTARLTREAGRGSPYALGSLTLRR